MCNEFITLAQSNDYRQIAICEHGTIHLTWDLVTIYLDDTIFSDLIATLDKAADLTQPGKVKDGHCCVFLVKKGYFQVWVRNIAMNLSIADFMIFTEMCRVAESELPYIDGAHTDGVHPVDDVIDVSLQSPQRTTQASSTNRFSLN